MNLKSILLLGLVVSISACGGGDPATDPNTNPNTNPNTGPGTTPSGDSIYTVSGTQLGTNVAANSELRKIIPFSIVNPNSDFTIGTAYAAKSTATSSGVYWTVEVTNASNQAHCFIRIDSGRYLASDGTELAVESFTYAKGLLRKVSASVNTNTCLLPGDTGHFIGIDTAITMEQVSSITFNSIAASISGDSVQVPDVSMKALSYTADAPQLLQNIDLTVQNLGPGSASIDTLSLSIVLDDNNVPLRWTFFSLPTGSSGTVAVNQTGIVSANWLHQGIASKILIYLDFDAVTPIQAQITASSLQPTLTLEDFSSTEEYFSYLLDIKNQNENVKELSQ